MKHQTQRHTNSKFPVQCLMMEDSHSHNSTYTSSYGRQYQKQDKAEPGIPFRKHHPDKQTGARNHIKGQGRQATAYDPLRTTQPEKIDRGNRDSHEIQSRRYLPPLDGITQGQIHAILEKQGRPKQGHNTQSIASRRHGISFAMNQQIDSPKQEQGCSPACYQQINFFHTVLTNSRQKPLAARQKYDSCNKSAKAPSSPRMLPARLLSIYNQSMQPSKR